MAPQKLHLQRVDAALPVEMAPGADAQLRLTTGGQGEPVQIQDPAQLGIVPASEQQHRALQQGLGHRVAPPELRALRIAAQPAETHAGRIVTFQQRQAIAQVGAAFKAATDLQPSGWILPPPTAFGRQLQGPAEAQAPPVGSSLAGPVQPLIQSAQRRHQAVGQTGAIAIVQQLAQSLIGKAVGAHLAVTAWQVAGPAHRRSAIGTFLAEAAERTAGVAAAAHVLHHH